MCDGKEKLVIKSPDSNDDRHSHTSIVAFVRSEHPCERLKSSPSHLEDGAGQNAGFRGCVRDCRHRPTRGRRGAISMHTTGLAQCTAIEGFELQTPHPHRRSSPVDFLLASPPVSSGCDRRF